MEKDSSKPRLSGVELTEEGAGGGDAIVSTESEGVAKNYNENDS
jgi:hypothetical protein